MLVGQLIVRHFIVFTKFDKIAFDHSDFGNWDVNKKSCYHVVNIWGPASFAPKRVQHRAFSARAIRSSDVKEALGN
jgi:hypothetical protein